MRRVREVWAHRTASEYRSATLAAQTLHWTLRLGLSPDTVRLAQRVVYDELTHAELCFGVYEAAGGTQGFAPVPDEWLTLQHDPDAPLVLRALAVAADEYAVAETASLALFKRLGRHSHVDAVGPVIRRILEDEARHSAFGWHLVDELLEITGAEGRQFLRARVDGYLERVRTEYASGAPPCTPDEEAWGLMSAALYGPIVDEALAQVRDRFHRLGAVGATAT